ncbi:RING finger protein 223 [Synchiropus splendidus]|uniref:RING finger protein 223 n=1 Tax=Synchiropus splendidus TaxID=270530 RepID=UPI00237D81E8|nr:RING finger protein 223 [Synchiropus splendidus]
MERPPQIWHMPPSDQAGELQKKVSIANQPECSICYNSYDNVFKTPKLLDCTHIFCLECLSRLMSVSRAEGNSTPLLSCPFCRQPTLLPEAGPPALTTSAEVLCKLPAHQRQEQSVWLDGQKLCSKSTRHNPSTEAPDSPTALCICIDIGVSKSVDSPVETETRTHRATGRFGDWRRVLLFVLLMVLLVVVVLWPLQCVFSTGNMRCTQRPKDPLTTVASMTSHTSTERPPLHH